VSVRLKKTRLVSVLLVCLVAAGHAAAQLYVFPGRKSSSPTTCTTCPGANANLPTYQFDRPLFAHAGRYVDSTTTGNIQNLGMRTVRARQIRVSEAHNRIYIALGEAIGSYTLDTWFATHLRKPMGTMAQLQTTGAPINGRSPLEKVSVPHQYFYAEMNSSSGWITGFQDAQEILTDFDADDRGNVYIGTHYFGWGIAHDDGLENGSHMAYRFQEQPAIRPVTVFSFKRGTTYYAVISETVRSAGAYVLYNVTNPEVPQSPILRNKTNKVQDDKYGIVAVSKYEAGERLGFINTDGHVRIYSYEGFVNDEAPLADYTPGSGKKFSSIAFDGTGRLWIAESSEQVESNVLHRATPNGNLYTKTTLNIYGGVFSPDHLDISTGFLAVGGRSMLDGVTGSDMRLYRIENDTLTLMDDGGFFRRYYHLAPTGYADPGNYTAMHSFKLVEQGGKTFLVYSARGLGDVYELTNNASRIPTSISLRTEGPGTNVDLIATVTASSMGAAALSGQVSLTLNGQPLTNATVSGTNDPLTFIVNIHRSDMTKEGILAAVYEGDAYYAPSSPASLNYAPATLSAPTNLAAVRASTTSIALTWDAVSGVNRYEVLRKDAGSAWVKIAEPATPGYLDLSVVPNQAYLYRVRGYDTRAGAESVTEIATTYTFADDPLNAGTPIKAAHIVQLRTVTNAVRVAAGLSEYNFTDESLDTGSSIRAIHATELHLANEQVRAILGLAPLPAATHFSRTDMNILRDSLK
jgi:hypothetical protein